MLHPAIQKVVYPSPAAAIASYNYSDVAEGTGAIIFYGWTSNASGAVSYTLTGQSLYSNDTYTEAGITEVAHAKVIDVDFDTTFNMPKNLKGKIKAFMTIGAGRADAVGDSEANIYVILKARKYDGTTETELGEVRSDNFNGAGSGTLYGYTTIALQINISSIIHFKKGETLRMTIEVYGKRNGTNTSNAVLLHDPKNRIADGDIPSPQTTYPAKTSVVEFHVPFILDLG